MEIKIESGQLQKSKKSGKEYTNCKLSDGSYLNIWGDQTKHIGKKVNINEPNIFGKAKWTSIDESKPEVKPEPVKHDGISKEEYLTFMEEVWGVVAKLEPDTETSCGAQARAALVNTAMINYCQGKIIIESEEPPEEEPE